MESHSDPTENIDSILSDTLQEFQSANEDINHSISSTRKLYNFDPSETFPEADLLTSRSINVVYNYLKTGLESTESNNQSLPITRTSSDNLSKSSISLSTSVAEINPEYKKLQLLFPLEDTYRARYKSDYFPQTGVVRRPRYIADSASNHFITLQLPKEYQNDFQNLYIRIALITQFIEGHGHYYSPYKFQRDHNDIKIPDENPIYIKVETCREDNFIIRLQLVLIKSKLDQLNYNQPLKVFSDTATHIQNIIHEARLAPKDLIEKYQLDKSRLAFTLCTKLPDGSYVIDPETTTISSVITEATTTKKANESASTSSVEPKQNICCPHCSHNFDPDAPSESNQKNKRKSSTHSCSKVTTEKHSNKKKKNG